jgi:hypothetical protein
LSSILKALKKIEEKSSRTDSFFTMPKTIDTQPQNNSKTRRRWLIPGVIIGFLILLVLAIATIDLFSRRQPIITKKFPAEVSDKQTQRPASLMVKSNIFKAKIPPRSINRAKSGPKRTQLAKNQTKSSPPAVDTKEIPAKARSIAPKATIDQQNTKLPTTVRSPKPETTPTSKAPLQKRPPPKATASKKSVAARSVPSGKPATKTKQPDRTRTYDRLDDAKFKLQALAWFNDASKRMAVINSHIVREGGSVDGYQVTQIRQQDVVVSDGKKSWRVEFGLKH